MPREADPGKGTREPTLANVNPHCSSMTVCHVKRMVARCVRSKKSDGTGGIQDAWWAGSSQTVTQGNSNTEYCMVSKPVAYSVKYSPRRQGRHARAAGGERQGGLRAAPLAGQGRARACRRRPSRGLECALPPQL